MGEVTEGRKGGKGNLRAKNRTRARPHYSAVRRYVGPKRGGMWLGCHRNLPGGCSLRSNVQCPKGKKSFGPAPEAAISKGAGVTGTVAAAGPVILRVR